MTKVRGNSEVKAMRRTLQPLFAATAGLSLLLAACAGESPTAPKPPTNGGDGGACTVTVSLDSTSVTPLAGTAIILRATVRKGGALVPDGTSVIFTTDFGYFLETGLPSVSKVTQNGFADVTLGATASGLAKVKATFECGSAEKSIDYQPVPANGPFISSISPTSGSCAGGDPVTINGGRFGSAAANVRVLFGGNPATVRSVSDTQLSVLTPAKTLSNPQVPEKVDIVILFFVDDIPAGNVAASKAFTYYCVDPNKRLTVTSVTPNSGKPEGGQQVIVTGSNFLPSQTSSAATTRVTFGASPASVVSVTDTQITVQTPRHILANPAVPETVDVAVTADLGLVSQQSGLLPNSFTYRSDGGGSTCAGAPGLFIATVKPAEPTTSGSPDGGDVVVVTGGGFLAGATSAEALSRTQVFFGGIQGVVSSVNDSELRVTTPRRILANPDKPETVDVRVIVDAGGPREACIEVTKAYTYYPGGSLVPVITSMSPSSGPNDVSTRVTLFGRNFKLPMQVFVGGVEAAVVDIRASEIVFLTPVATGPNSGLAGRSWDVTVRDPYATDPDSDITSPVQFRYYACPTVNTVVPASAPWNQATVVTVTGQSFEEPVEVTFTSGGLVLRPSVTSVSSSLITFVMPVIDPRLGGTAGQCGNVTGNLQISFPALGGCTAATAPFTYRVDAMTATGATPTQLTQVGGLAVTVIGTNFVHPMSVELIKNGSAIANTRVDNVVVANSGQLTFLAPPVPDGAFNEEICVPTGGTSLTGRRWIPTAFGIRLRNNQTGCTVDLPSILMYTPSNTTCRTPLALTGVPPATGTICQAYGPATFTVSGGTGPYTITTEPVVFQYGLLPTIAAGSATISASPLRLQTTGPVLSPNPTSYPITVNVTDAVGDTASASYTLAITDPAASFTPTADQTTLAAPTVTSDTATVTAPTGIGTVTLTAGTPTPALSTGVTFGFVGGVATLQRTVAQDPTTSPAGTSTVVITAADVGCGGTHHEGTVTLTLNY